MSANQPLCDVEIFIAALDSIVEAERLFRERYSLRIRREAHRCCPILTNRDLVQVDHEVTNHAIEMLRKGELDTRDAIAPTLIRLIRRSVSTIAGVHSPGQIIYFANPHLRKRWDSEVASRGQAAVYGVLRKKTELLSDKARCVLRALVSSKIDVPIAELADNIAKATGRRLNFLQISIAIDEISRFVGEVLSDKLSKK